ncbi:hypothetical protein yc1106_02470 [Curvularia clavata]|uniref:Uncharacterized protein n=1 Tax=Curvularia clavata TaxID=95742 RepID=A0A9Q8Z3E7_CURCL|nr:hypothetical protein yc1106_02470 [Curvularia clavata]
MFLFHTLLALWLYLNYAATLVLAQGNLTTITITATLMISVYAFAPTSSMMATLPANTTFLTLAAIPTTATEGIQSHIAQYHALYSSAPTISTSSSPPPITTDPPYLQTATNPEWLLSVSMALLCYDFLAATAFIWCWVMGYLWWWRRTSRSAEVRALRAGREESSILGMLMTENLEGEMRSLGMV